MWKKAEFPKSGSTDGRLVYSSYPYSTPSSKTQLSEPGHALGWLLMATEWAQDME
jgi:hypothetical protein